jgi:hypothetical protein
MKLLPIIKPTSRFSSFFATLLHDCAPDERVQLVSRDQVDGLYLAEAIAA